MLLQLSKELGLRSGKDTLLDLTNIDINCHLSLTPCELAQIANACSWWAFTRFHVGVHQAIKQQKVCTLEQLKFTHINFNILNSYITVIYLRLIKNTYFYAVKQKTWKWLYWLFSSRKTYNKIASVRKSYISKSFKK